MANERTVIRGIVLRSVDTREADKILTVLTGEQGKLAVVAKGARSRRSRVTAATQFLAYSEMTLTERRGWQILAEANTIELFSGVREDLERLSLASYFAELTDAVTYEDLPAGEILPLLLNALYALGTLHYPPAVVKPAFEVKLMALSGFEQSSAAYRGAHAGRGPRDPPLRPLSPRRGGSPCPWGRQGWRPCATLSTETPSGSTPSACRRRRCGG